MQLRKGPTNVQLKLTSAFLVSCLFGSISKAYMSRYDILTPMSFNFPTQSTPPFKKISYKIWLPTGIGSPYLWKNRFNHTRQHNSVGRSTKQLKQL